MGSITMNPILISKTVRQNSSAKSTARRFTMAAGVGLLLIAGATTSCNTVAGVGKDVEKGGDKIQDAAH